MVEPVGEVSVINGAQPRLVYRLDGVDPLITDTTKTRSTNLSEKYK